MPAERRENVGRHADRQAEYDALIEPDPLLAEVGQANEGIDTPGEAERVVLSRPCDDDASTAPVQRSREPREQAAAAAKRKQTLKHLPNTNRRALGKQGAYTARSRRRAA